MNYVFVFSKGNAIRKATHPGMKIKFRVRASECVGYIP